MEARSDAPFSGEVEAGRMSNLYASSGGEVGGGLVDRAYVDRGGCRGHGACGWLQIRAS